MESAGIEPTASSNLEFPNSGIMPRKRSSTNPRPQFFNLGILEKNNEDRLR